MSAGLQGIEPIVTALQERLQDGLAEHLATVGDDHPEGPVLEVPSDSRILDYIPAISEVREFPTIGILHGRGTFEDDNAWSATGVYRVGLVSFMQHAEPDMISRYSRRFTLAVMRCALEGRRISTGSPWSMVLESIDYGPSLADIPDGSDVPSRYITWSAVTITCRHEEE